MYRMLISLALAAGFAAPVASQDKAQQEKHGNFTLRIITDPMTDASRGILASPTEDDITMVVKCDSNGPGTLYISFIAKNYLGALRNNRREIKYRIDGAQAEGISAYYDGRTASILDLKPGTNEGRWFARVLGASKLTVQLTSYDYDSYAQVIDLTGFRAGVGRAAATCRDANWYGSAG